MLADLVLDRSAKEEAIVITNRIDLWPKVWGAPRRRKPLPAAPRRRELAAQCVATALVQRDPGVVALAGALAGESAPQPEPLVADVVCETAGCGCGTLAVEVSR